MQKPNRTMLGYSSIRNWYGQSELIDIDTLRRRAGTPVAAFPRGSVGTIQIGNYIIFDLETE